MTIYTLLIGGGLLAALSILLISIIHLAKKQGELNVELEDDKIEIETQKKYLEIASRPQSSANVILKRMRKDRKDK